MRVSGRRISIVDIANERFWQIAILTAAGTIGAGSQADAALFYWQDSDPGYYYRSEPMAQPRQQKVRRPSAKKDAAPEKQVGAKPQGPLIIAVSIQKQKVRIYDSNGFFAESPVSTGMPGHSTPMGVFSVIQKHKFHHSNIYSGAPMPYMQRITWSGVAMHAGVLPGYPASHGCIRMPMAFAVKMWNWTKMGARVIITPGEMTPANFSHPLLVTQKAAPQPVALEELKVDAPLGVKSDKGADAGAATKAAKASLDLRSTVGHATEPPASAPLRAQTHTADATSAVPGPNSSATMSDVSPAAEPAGNSAQPASADAAYVKLNEVSNAETKSEAEAAQSETESAPAENIEATSSVAKPVEAKSPEAATGETVKAEEKPAEVKIEARADAIKTEAPRSEIIKETVKETVKTETPQADTTKPDEPKAVEAPADPTGAAADATASTPEAKKDPTRLPGVAKPEALKRTGQVAIFISGKDSKLYVRQNFSPLFDVPVTIAPSDRPLGTHVFTAEADKNDANLLRWSVVSLPAGRHALRNDDEDRSSRRRKMAGVPAEVKPLPVPDSPAEALDRIAIPPDAMARIAEALTTGASIIVSDQGINQGETGEGTDFIVSLR
jgi:lipoprotein-anchoring transpeptidase ErfK/SrfK